MARLGPDQPPGDEARPEALRRLDVLDPRVGAVVERLTRLAARALGAPMAVIATVGHDRVRFLSCHGLEVRAARPGVDGSACPALLGAPWAIEDARRDPRTARHPLVIGEAAVRFCAGAPLWTHDGLHLGALCVLDREPRQLSDSDRLVLDEVAATVVDVLELRLAARPASPGAAGRVRLLEERQRQAMQLNDDVVQRLAIVHMALAVGSGGEVAGHVDRALEAAKRILAEMASEAPTLRRDRPAGGGAPSRRRQT